MKSRIDANDEYITSPTVRPYLALPHVIIIIIMHLVAANGRNSSTQWTKDTSSLTDAACG